MPAHDLNQFLSQVRVKSLLNVIDSGVDQNMPCGDQRIATLLMRFGALILTNPKRRSFTSGWELTELGKTKIHGT